ncbi:hypothetical protein MKX03_009107 [Papaver bracteatum]|nr:hypothetical protein MKX03_009107 [Papaver bracteatum]
MKTEFMAIWDGFTTDREFSSLVEIPYVLACLYILTLLSVNVRSMLYRAFGHIISNTPISAVVTDSKRVSFRNFETSDCDFVGTALFIIILNLSFSFSLQVISSLLDSLFLLSLDERDKDLMYNLLLILSGIIVDENGYTSNYKCFDDSKRAVRQEELLGVINTHHA